MKTTYPKKQDVEPQFLIIDATDQVLGRLAAKAASLLRGKHKPIFHPAVDTGDYVIIINADKVRLTGKKELQKVYYRHSGYPGGIKMRTFQEMKDKFPERIIEKAVRGMIPHNRLGDQVIKKLKVYAGEKHPHEAQKPVQVTL